MKSARSPKLLILLTVLVDLIGFGIVIPLLPVYADSFQATGLQIGMLLAIHSAMQFLFGPILGKLSDRFGRRPVLIYSILGNVVAYALFATADSLWMLFLARFISGISAGNITSAQAYLADITPREKRAAAMGMLGAAFGVGFVLGPAMAGLLARYGTAVPFWAAMVLSIINAVSVMTLLPESLTPEKRAEQAARRASGGAAWPSGTRFPLLLTVFFLGICGFTVLTTLFPLYMARRFGFDSSQVGYTFAFIGVIGAIVQGGLVRRLEPRTGSKTLVVTGHLIVTASLVFLGLANSVPAMLFYIALIAIGNGFFQPAVNAMASRVAYDHHQGRALGYLGSAGSLGRVVGPLIAGSLMIMDGPGERFGAAALFASAAITLLSALLLLFVPSDRRVQHDA